MNLEGTELDVTRSQGGTMGEMMKSWVMVLLTLVFVALYMSALIGWLRPLADVTMITRLEPIIFVIIGYYFGRLPAQANERTLKEEIDRQTKKSDVSQHAKETAERERDVLEEKGRNIRITLAAVKTPAVRTSSGKKNLNLVAEDEVSASGVSNTINTAIQILDS